MDDREKTKGAIKDSLRTLFLGKALAFSESLNKENLLASVTVTEQTNVDTLHAYEMALMAILEFYSTGVDDMQISYYPDGIKVVYTIPWPPV